jgi:hypothetical protein
MGAGLGWHLQAALEVFSPQRIIVYAPRADEKNWVTCLGPQLPSLTWVADAQEMAQALGRLLVYGAADKGVKLFAAPAYRESFPQLWRQIQDMAENALIRSKSDRFTRSRLSATWNSHLADNAEILFTRPDITLAPLAFANRPALVVGAGPSLDMSLPALSRMREQALVLAAASVLGPMAAYNLKPHVVVALESKDESRQFVAVDSRQTILLAALNGNPQHFRQWPGRAAFFHPNSWLPKFLNWGSVLPSGGHATSAAFSLACLWGCSPIILVGQDLAYSNGRTHAAARPGGEDEKKDRLIGVAALDGGQINTSSIMLSYLEWYQEAAAHLRKNYPHIKVINATAAGAAISGFSREPLSACLSKLPLGPDPGSSLLALWQSLPLLSPGHIRHPVSLVKGLLSRSLDSPHQLWEILKDTPLRDWCLEEGSAPNWRRSLAHLRRLLAYQIGRAAGGGRV